MKVVIEPPDDYRTLVPINLFVTEAKGELSAEVSGMGEISFTSRNGGHSAQFYVQEIGDYQLIISDAGGKQVFPIRVEEQVFLNFKTQFGLFSILFLIVMTGVVLWIKKTIRPT